MNNRVAAALIACLPALAACNQPEPDEEVGEIQLAITQVPPGVASLVIKAQASLHAVERCFPVTPGRDSVLSMPGIPAGSVKVAATAFSNACPIPAGALPGWLSDTVTVTVPAGGSAAVMLVMRRAGRIDVTVDFQAGCPTGQLFCSQRDGSLRCTDVSIDPINCGRCGNACTVQQRCMNGQCVGGPTCPVGQTLCQRADGSLRCTDTQTDQVNCGRCGNVCPVQQRCMGGQCVGGPTCPVGQSLCQRPDGSTRCTDTQTDTFNCGRCGNACPSMLPRCRAGVCS